MLKVQMLLLFIFLLIINTPIVEAQISQEDIAKCINALSYKVNPSMEKESYFEFLNDDNIETLRYFGYKNHGNRRALKTFANKIKAMKTYGHGFNTHKSALINVIFSFMSKVKGLTEDGRINTNVLPNYIQEIIDLLNRLSPIEMFIHTRIIEKAIKKLEDDGKIDFKHYESEDLFEGLSNVLQETYTTILQQTDSDRAIVQIIKTTLQNNLFKKDKRAMQNEGFSDSYISGFDYATESLRLAEALREKRKFIDPYTTHIPEFAALIDIHIAFIKRGIKSQDSSDKFERLQLLDSFESEAHFRRRSRDVTYQWWFNFNLRLAILITPEEYRDKDYLLNIEKIGELIENNKLEIFCLECIYRYGSIEEINDDDGSNVLFNSVEDFSALVNEFPKRIMIPTVYDLGISSINKTYGTSVHLIRLNKEPVDVNDNPIYPDDFFLLDVYDHALNREVDNQLQFFRSYFLQKLEALTKPEREAVEYIYFNLTHEEFDFSEVIDPERIKSLSPPITKLMAEKYADAFATPDDLILIDYYDDIREFMSKGERAFIRLIAEISEEVGIVRRSFLSVLSEQQITSLYYLIIDKLIKYKSHEEQITPVASIEG